MKLFIGEILGNHAILIDEEAHHLQRVMRINVGEIINVTDGLGKIYEGKITDISKKKVTIEELTELDYLQQRNYKIEMVVSPTKQMDRIENFLEKAVEVGLDAYHPIISFHSERRKINHERLEKIAMAAMKQSLKAEKTKIFPLMKFEDFIKENTFSGQKFIAHCHKDIDLHPIKEVVNPNISYQFLIGPEGDFSREEIELAIEHGYMPISLGNQRLRTETAALSCVMLAHYLHL